MAGDGFDWRVSINLSGQDLSTGSAAELLPRLAAEAGVAPGSIVAEAPESALVADDAMVASSLRRLAQAGFVLALDSGGALPLDGYDLPKGLFAEVKMAAARSSASPKSRGSSNAGRIARRLKAAQDGGLRSVAVGVESEATLTALVKLGFGAVQGALVRKPGPLDELLAWDGAWAGEPDAKARTPRAAVARRRAPEPAEPAPAAAAHAPMSPAPEPVRPATVPAPARYEPPPAPPAAAFAAADDDDALDVGFDDDLAPIDAVSDDDDLDPSEDMAVDDRELEALDALPSLSAAMIDRPKRKPSGFVDEFRSEIERPRPAVTVEAQILPLPSMAERGLALRVKSEKPAKRGLLVRLFGR